MTKDDMVKLARSVGLRLITRGNYFFISHEHLSELLDAQAKAERNRVWTQSHWTEYENSIAAAEREACAKVVEEIEARSVAKDVDDPPLNHVAAAIRARGQQ